MLKMARRLVSAAGVGERAQSGAAVVIVAASMLVLVGFAAFAVDFGWLYLNGIRIQHGADAAALAGVIYEPGERDVAYAEARGSASENGYTDGLDGTVVTPEDYLEGTGAVENQYQLRVTISDNVDTFFMRLFGIDDISMSRSAVAEYVLPLPMGSNLPYFGEDPSVEGHDPHFWANIHGWWTNKSMGDRYASQCESGNGDGCPENEDGRDIVFNDDGYPIAGGYVYGIELDDTATGLTVEIFDGQFFEGGGDQFLVGDNEQGAPFPHTWFVLYDADPTPLNTADGGNEVLCTWRAEPDMSPADFNDDGTIDGADDLNGGGIDWDDFDEPGSGFPNGAADLWVELCTESSLGQGVYPLRVVTENSDSERGLNRYSIRTSSLSGNQPRIYGLGDMSVYVNFIGDEATLNLAEIQPVHAGKDLVIELWDPDSGNEGTEIVLPDGVTMPDGSSNPPCTWNKINEPGVYQEHCDLNYDPDEFHNSQLEIRVHIPEDYTCSTTCWWKIKVAYADGRANDTTTWSARIEGNPVALVK